MPPLDAVRERIPLGVRPAESTMVPDANDLSVAHDHGANQRVGLNMTNRPHRGACSEVERGPGVSIGRSVSHGRNATPDGSSPRDRHH